jgi:hypothetical protein
MLFNAKRAKSKASTIGPSDHSLRGIQPHRQKKVPRAPRITARAAGNRRFY